MRWLARVVCSSVVLAVSTTGCARDEKTPLAPACREGPDSVMAALRAAPGAVTLEGTTLSDCLRQTSENGSSAELTELGSGYVEAAARLARAAQRRPAGAEALRLGYLIGAIRSVPADTQGTSIELVRRVESEAAQADPRSPAYRRGLRAGRHAG